MPKHSLNEFRRIFAFDFKFKESKRLDDIAEKLTGKFDFENIYNFEEVIEHIHNKGQLSNWKKAIAMNSSVVYP